MHSVGFKLSDFRFALITLQSYKLYLPLGTIACYGNAWHNYISRHNFMPDSDKDLEVESFNSVSSGQHSIYYSFRIITTHNH